MLGRLKIRNLQHGDVTACWITIARDVQVFGTRCFVRTFGMGHLRYKKVMCLIGNSDDWTVPCSHERSSMEAPGSAQFSQIGTLITYNLEAPLTSLYGQKPTTKGFSYPAASFFTMWFFKGGPLILVV